MFIELRESEVFLAPVGAQFCRRLKHWAPKGAGGFGFGWFYRHFTPNGVRKSVFISSDLLDALPVNTQFQLRSFEHSDFPKES